MVGQTNIPNLCSPLPSSPRAQAFIPKCPSIHPQVPTYESPKAHVLIPSINPPEPKYSSPRAKVFIPRAQVFVP
ncbi:hypothetical protein BC629DRAFT_155641 [Irpex lacteus]|nr:hypothetical protein BC629DRAFT_155641 [Irpex lacteus]